MKVIILSILFIFDVKVQNNLENVNINEIFQF